MPCYRVECHSGASHTVVADDHVKAATQVAKERHVTIRGVCLAKDVRLLLKDQPNLLESHPIVP